METIITRVMKIEKQSSLDIERAEDACRKNIEKHRLALEQEKERVQSLIAARENERLAQALQDLKKQTEEALLTTGRDYEILFQDSAKINAIKEKIIAILIAE